MTQTEFHHAKPVYEEFPGWREDLSTASTFADLPANAQAYVRALEEMSGAPISARSASAPAAKRKSSCTISSVDPPDQRRSQ